jgi:hypothetical protein
MASIVDGVLIVAVSGQTNRRALAPPSVRSSVCAPNLLGVVLNRMENDSGSGYYHNYYYPKNYTYPQAGASN